MNRKKEAALTGVVYYLLEEEQELTGVDGENSPGPGIPAWSQGSRNLSAEMRRMIQSRNFSPPAGCFPVMEKRTRGGSPALSMTQKKVEHQIRLTGYTAKKRNLSSSSKWNSGS